MRMAEDSARPSDSLLTSNTDMSPNRLLRFATEKFDVVNKDLERILDKMISARST